MQMLFDGSEETPGAAASACSPARSRWIPPGVKRPQMQWNQVVPVDADDPMFAGLGERPWFYFVHSLHGVPDDPSTIAATCDYGGPVNAAFRRGNVFATQFHPEKSAAAGLGLLGNFVSALSVPRSMTMLYPSIDLRGGRVVRLRQGDYAAETDLRRRPGRAWPRVLRRRARRGSTSSTSTRRARASRSTGRPWPPIVAAVAGRAAVQTGGGVRSLDDAEALADAGVARVVMGSAAVAAARRSSTTSRGRRPWPSGSTTAAASWPCTAGPRPAACTLADALVRFAGGRRVRDHRHRPRRHARRSRRRRARRAVAATTVPVIASGGVGTLDDVARPRRHRRPARDHHRHGRSTRGASRVADARSRAGADVIVARVDPVPRRHRRPGRQGHELRRPARRRRPGRAGRPLRRRGRRRARVPRHHGVQRRPRHDGRRRVPHGRAGVHPVHRRRRHPHRRGRPPHAAGRGRQGQRQHRGRRSGRS